MHLNNNSKRRLRLVALGCIFLAVGKEEEQNMRQTAVFDSPCYRHAFLALRADISATRKA